MSLIFSVRNSNEAVELFWNVQLSNGQCPKQILMDVVRKKKYQRLLKSRKPEAPSVAWEMIADEMAVAGVPVPSKGAALLCKQKWSCLKQRNRKPKQNVTSNILSDEISEYVSSTTRETTLSPVPDSEDSFSSNESSSDSYCTSLPQELLDISGNNTTKPFRTVDIFSCSTNDRCTCGTKELSMAKEFLELELEKVENFGNKICSLLEEQNKLRKDFITFLSSNIDSVKRKQRKRRRSSSSRI